MNKSLIHDKRERQKTGLHKRRDGKSERREENKDGWKHEQKKILCHDVAHFFAEIMVRSSVIS